MCSSVKLSTYCTKFFVTFIDLSERSTKLKVGYQRDRCVSIDISIPRNWYSPSLVFSDEKQLERNVVLKNFLWLMLAWKLMLLYRATWCPVEAALFLGGIPLINTTLLQKIPCDKWNWISDIISLTLLPSLLLFDMTALSNTAFTFKKGHWRSAGPSAEIHWQLCLGAIALTAQSN